MASGLLKKYASKGAVKEHHHGQAQPAEKRDGPGRIQVTVDVAWWRTRATLKPVIEKASNIEMASSATPIRPKSAGARARAISSSLMDMATWMKDSSVPVSRPLPAAALPVNPDLCVSACSVIGAPTTLAAILKKMGLQQWPG